jgi:hypothetical protein
VFVRVLNALLGFWLFVSAFMWPHTTAQFHNAWVTGMLVTVFAVAAIAGVHRARFLNFVLALWLFFSTLFLPRLSAGTAVNHMLLAVALIVTSLFPLRVRTYRLGRGALNP